MTSFEIEISDEEAGRAESEIFFKDKDVECRLHDLLLDFFQENMKFERNIQISGQVSCLIDDVTKLVFLIPESSVKSEHVQVTSSQDEKEIPVLDSEHNYIKKTFAGNVEKRKSKQKKKYTEKMSAAENLVKNNECPFCNFKDPCKHALNRHLKIKHLKVKQFECGLCNFTSIRRGAIKAHNLRFHEKVRPYNCDLCSFSAFTLSGLKYHTSVTHTKEFKFRCPHCEYATVTNSILQKHITCVHENRREYECEHCNFAASRRYDLTRHLTTKAHMMRAKNRPGNFESGKLKAKKIAKMHDSGEQQIIDEELDDVEPDDVEPNTSGVKSNIEKSNYVEKGRLSEVINTYHCDECHFFCFDMKELRRHIFDAHV